ncbi:MAG: hypothetical protein JO112_07960 [Planctomycetes bacterium]|nr:hypothetical protein [Planctomycetota bacterium]
MEPGLYQFLENASPYLIGWSFLFTLITTVRIVFKVRRGVLQLPDNAILTELAGLPLAVLLSVSFVRAVLAADWISILLFLWWGPGFVATLVTLLIARLRRRRIDWHPVRYLISYLCKLNYLAFMVVFFRFAMPGMIFAFSVWIINDQYEKAFMSLDADRTRRTFHDFWLPRLLYPAGLLVPYFYPRMSYRWFDLLYGTVLLVLWVSGLAYIRKKGRFFALPRDPTLLRNMIYFPRLRVQGAPAAESPQPVVQAGLPGESSGPGGDRHDERAHVG